jgi:hypothetical protein
MTFPFFRRKRWDDPEYFRKHATLVRSAEGQYPRLRNTRTLEENREAMQRIKRYRAMADEDG